jgi:hypothetical protein|tara:strand:+ start:67 stop:255 length:189 start_codon:yes stop_codon:yes gene_type:complete
MKVLIKEEVKRDGVILKEGDIIEIPDANVPVWVSKGWGKPIEKKEEKGVKETKELKTEKKNK